MNPEERNDQRQQARKWGIRFAHKLENRKTLAENQNKPANTLNGVSFAELMRMLGGGV